MIESIILSLLLKVIHLNPKIPPNTDLFLSSEIPPITSSLHGPLPTDPDPPTRKNESIPVDLPIEQKAGTHLRFSAVVLQLVRLVVAGVRVEGGYTMALGYNSTDGVRCTTE
ncbi:hypothetical protein CDAR_488331 [Caerostris darwini]|uniref:Uncharacterized protein n=1 Tax=Caerostris darwini TaxID=1538125 RepID=A0AAV4Q090_9ARAC|nr:hypothetical protein CDAR_488331 [Caerostris darwini]